MEEEPIPPKIRSSSLHPVMLFRFPLISLTNVAAGLGISLAPGFLNGHSGQFAWLPYECKESFSCVLCTHKADSRKSLSAFIEVLKKLYQDAVAFPL